VRHRGIALLALIVACAVAVSACGGAANHPAAATHAEASTAAPNVPLASSTPDRPPAVSELGAAERPRVDQFPAATGRTLTQLATLAHSVAQLGAATGNFTTGTRRFAFALTNKSERYVYAPTAIYIGATPTSPAKGPFLAPADPMSVAPQYRSEQNAGPGGLEAIYWTELPLPRSGVYDLLSLTRVGSSLVGATSEMAVASSSPIPNVGQRPPAIATDTLASVHGDVALLTTRLPPEDMHSVSFNQVLGKRPVALLFSTPQLCTSRVCGPVTDLTVELAHQFAGRIVFIHEEVYVNNQPAKGLRPQLKAFHLLTEPWLFAVNRRGVIVARLEGAFGVNELRQALQAALS
jgi:hypothetical protein